MGPASWVSPLGMPCCCFRADGGPQRGVLGILGCGAKVWLGYRPPAGQLTGGQEKKVAEERGERNGRGRGRQERGGQAWSGGGRQEVGATSGWHGGRTHQHSPGSLPPPGGLTFPPASQWAGPAAGSRLPCSLRAARLRPRRRWHGDSSQVCKLVPLSPGQGEPWRLANMTQENVC